LIYYLFYPENQYDRDGEVVPKGGISTLSVTVITALFRYPFLPEHRATFNGNLALHVG